MNAPRLLTKSRFKVGLGCPTKLFYTKKPTEWGNQNLDDPFLIELAKGGYQVGELAKCYHPNGIEIEELDYEISLQKTNELLKKENVTIFEGAVRFENLFVRVDIIKKTGNRVELIEVKSKSISSSTLSNEIWDKRKKNKEIYSLKAGWKPYILDLAFQNFVLKKAFPEFEISSFLFCPDKERLSSVDGLNQKFRVNEESPSNYSVEIIGDVSSNSLGNPIMEKVELSSEIGIILDDKLEPFESTGMNFTDSVQFLSEIYEKDEFIKPSVSKDCKSCEFRCDQLGLKNGFANCWESKGVFNLSEPFVFDIWNFRNANKLISQGIYQFGQLREEHVKKESESDPLKMKTSTRQWLQVEKEINNDSTPTYYTEGLKQEMSKWEFPLHMIDFETSRVAIPFLKNKRPYEQIAFQFSHHQINADESVEHKGQFLCVEPGAFPNFDFVRALKKELENDSGSIFMYHHHEQNVLCDIIVQLESSSESDKSELIDFIKSITTKKSGNKIEWQGDRSMIDLCQTVKNYYYNPMMKNSNSIKAVLPAILNESTFLQNKYGKEIYGAGREVNSLNFEEMIWIRENNGSIDDPYKFLDSKIHNWEYLELEEYMSDPKINNGGAAMVAYAVLQFINIPEAVRKRIVESLLRYCELDTLAMVFVWEHWNHLLQETKHVETA